MRKRMNCLIQCNRCLFNFEIVDKTMPITRRTREKTTENVEGKILPEKKNRNFPDAGGFCLHVCTYPLPIRTIQLKKSHTNPTFIFLCSFSVVPIFKFLFPFPVFFLKKMDKAAKKFFNMNLVWSI